MNYKFVLCFLLFTLTVFSQNTYFIKYNNYIGKNQVSSKIISKEIFSNSDDLLNKETISAAPFAKGIANQHEIFGRIIKVTFPETVSASLIMQLGNTDPEIDYIQPMIVYQIDGVPNDTLAVHQWGLEKTKAYEAWDITTGNDSVIIGIIDTGIDYLHPDLENKIYINPGETGTDQFGNDKRFNGIDDDGNGFIDDYMGWDFTDRVGFPFDSTGGDYLDWDNDPADQQGHGTYIAGIAGAETNNIRGVAGAAPNLKLINLRAFDPGGYGEEDDVAAAILYAVNNGVKVLNMSFGDYSFSYVLRDVIQYAYSQNVVMVASSGNSNSPNPHYPSAYPEVISVGNSTSQDGVSSNSNWGSTLDLVAPGSLIMTTARNDNYAIISGTSASAPFVCAAAGLILSLNDFTNEEVKQILKSTTDDILTPGWDLRSGAGRLNIFKALSVIAPSRIKINHPRHDFSTLQDTLIINATVQSPYFVRYELLYGTGLNPASWTTLVDNGINQFVNEDIFTLPLASLKDSVYCIRLVVHLNNGRTLEERSNFYLIRTPPQADLITMAPMFYGEKSTIMAAVYTNSPSIVRLYYKQSSAAEYHFITLDGFNMNTQFVKYIHYGFIPVQLIQQNASYNVYIEAENLVGLKTQIDFPPVITTDYPAEYSSPVKLDVTLPPGDIFPDPVNFLTNDFTEILYRGIYPNTIPHYGLFSFEDHSFVKIDSIGSRIPRQVGDFNKNGRTDILSWFAMSVGNPPRQQRVSFMDEQESIGSFKFNTMLRDTVSFGIAKAMDIDFDGITEVISFIEDTIIVHKLSGNFQLIQERKLPNFTPKGIDSNLFDIPNVVITDLDQNGRNEIWAVDKDGDLFSYEVNEGFTFSKKDSVYTGFGGSASFIDAGDFNGDGHPEIAVLLRSIDQLDIAPFYRLLVFNLQNNQINKFMDQAFIDAAGEFGTNFQDAEKSMRFYDVDNDGKDELILFIFPHAYIFKESFGKFKIIHFDDNINSRNIFVGDLNKNNVPEVAFPTALGINFYEFDISNKASSPYHLSGYSIDSSSITLSWSGTGNYYRVFRGTDGETLVLIDSTDNKNYIDSGLENNTYYYYAVQAVDLSKPEAYSNLSRTLSIYSHNPARVISAVSTSSKTVTVFLSGRINTTIENLESFYVEGFGFPNSISPQSQNSYLLLFSNNLIPGTNHLIVSELRDLYGSPVLQDTVEFNVDPQTFTDELFISSYELINPYLIKITFNIEVDPSTAMNTANYEFSPDNKVTSVSIDQNDMKIIYLDLRGAKPVGSIGKEYRLHIKNLKSSSSTGSISINTGAGSYIVLTGFAADLSGVYVYPNPARVKGGGNVMFANLPQRAKITIFSLNGDQVNTIEESDGNGGVEFNLRNYDGEFLSSGIYIYRIIRLNNSGEEIEEKVGKFAVIR